MLASDKLSNDNVILSNTSALFSDKNVGTKTVTVSGISIAGGTDAGNYILSNTTATTTASITARPLTVTATAQNKVYDGTANASVTLNTDKIENDIITPSFTFATFSNKSVGTNKTVSVSGITISGSDAGNYTLANATATTTATITPNSIALTDATATNKVYDGSNVVDIGGTLRGILLDDNVSLTGKGTLASKNVGTHAVTSIGVTGKDAGNYTIILLSDFKATISPKELSLSEADAIDKIYDGTAEVEITGNLQGIIPPDAVSLGKGTLASQNVGTHTVTSIALAGADASNYTLASPTELTATISPRELTITALGENKIYDGTKAASVTLTTNKISDDDVVAAYTSATFADEKAGNNKTVTVTGISLTGDDMENYSLPDLSTLTTIASITQKELTVTGVSAADKIYDRTAWATLVGTPSLVGVVVVEGISDEVALNSGSAISATFPNKNVGNDKPVSVTGYALTGDDKDNYTLVQPTGLSADITRLALTVSNAGANDKMYDGSRDATITGILSGVISGDNVTLTRRGTFASRDVGTHQVTSTSFLDGSDEGNYTLIQPTGLTASITSRPLTIANAVANSKMYDGNTNTTITGTLTGIVNNDNVTLATKTGTFASPNVGTDIAVTSTSTLGGTEAHNYTLTQPTGLKANITARPLTLSNIAANDKVYDGNRNATINGTLTGILAGDVVTWNGVGTFAQADVNRQNGTREVLPIGVTYTSSSLAGGSAGNYSFTLPALPALSAKITPKVLEPVVATTFEKIYDGTTLFTTTAANLIGVIPPDHVELYINSQSSVVTNGTQTLTLSIGSTDKDNYDIFPKTITVTVIITRRPLTITAQGISKVYDGTINAGVNLSDNRVAGDVLTLTHSSASFDDKNVGTNKPIAVNGLSISGAAASNYALSNLTASTSANITARPLTITGLTPNGKVYDGTTNVLGFSGTAELNNQIAGDDITFSGLPVGTFASKDVGTRTVVVAGFTKGGNDANNYTLSQPTGLSAAITHREVTGSFTANDKFYDGNANATIATRTLENVVGQEDVSFDGAATFASIEVGKWLVTINEPTLTGNARSNYRLKEVLTTEATINPNTPLPVTLISFTARAQKEGTVLAWTTAAEKDNDYFQVERSADGKNFSAIGRVQGNGTSNVRVDYRYLDSKPLNGTAYYRLKQVDYDGKFEYSKTVAVQTKAIAASQVTVEAYPNPTPDAVNLDLTQLADSEVKVGVYALDGRLVKTSSLTGGKVQRLDLTDLSVGTYLVKVAGDGFGTVIRVVKQ